MDRSLKNILFNISPVSKYLDKSILIIFIIMEVFNKNYGNGLESYDGIISVILASSALILTLYKERKIKEENKVLYKIILLNIILAAFILFLSENNEQVLTVIYYISIGGCLIDIKNIKVRRSVYGVYIFLYIAIVIFRCSLYGFFVNTLVFFLVSYLHLLAHLIKKENTKIKETNLELLKYTVKEKEYYISKERDRISQELHDNIGHYFMALSMHIKFLEKIANENDKTLMDEINQMKLISEDGIKELRKTVYSLRKVEEINYLKKDIEYIIEKFNSMDLVNFQFNFNDCLECMDSSYKKVILDTIMEGITNSFKHGEADEISVNLDLIGKNVLLIIKDNGYGCDLIEESYGIKGIRKRIEDIGGIVLFESSINKGFCIEAKIPWEG